VCRQGRGTSHLPTNLLLPLQEENTLPQRGEVGSRQDPGEAHRPEFQEKAGEEADHQAGGRQAEAGSR